MDLNLQPILLNEGEQLLRSDLKLLARGDIVE